MEYKRILTIQDISCVGQCSTTVALPILSACGHETCILPTSILSTHTGGFGKPSVFYLDPMLTDFWHHWQQNNITFDAILVGYLGSVKAIETVMEIADALLAPDGVLIVDPAMADHGKLYSGFDERYVKAISKLCRKAHIIIPNITEAAMLSGQEYKEAADEAYIKQLLVHLRHNCVIMTGVGDVPEKTGIAVWKDERLRYYFHEKIGSSYHGTGDIFAACFTGVWMQKKNLMESVRIAADFTRKCIENTYYAPAHWYGVKFETALPYLLEQLQEKPAE